MGTSALLRVLDQSGNVLVAMRKQFDGFPTVFGKQIAEAALHYHHAFDGYYDRRAHNGIECLGLRIITQLKLSWGDLYLSHDREGLEYYNFRYDVQEHPGADEFALILSVSNSDDMLLFAGVPDAFLDMCKDYS